MHSGIECRVLSPSVLSARQTNELHAPLLRLPPELLRIILRLSTPYPILRQYKRYGPFRVYPDHPGGRLASWLQLGHICSKLRDTALGMRQMWAEAAFLV